MMEYMAQLEPFFLVMVSKVLVLVVSLAQLMMLVVHMQHYHHTWPWEGYL
jgi:hypothetical protein